MSIYDGYSICFNEWALDKKIKNELGLLVIISSLTAQTGKCWASNQYLGDLFGVDKFEISKKIKKLQDAGYIKKEHIKDEDGNDKRYIMLSKITTPVVENHNTPVVENHNHNNTTFKNINLKENKEKIYEKEFLEFWDKFPNQRKGNKQKAYNAWKRAIKEKRTTTKELIESVNEYVKSELVINGYASGCESWLNGDKFNWDYSPNKKKQYQKNGGYSINDPMNNYDYEEEYRKSKENLGMI